MDRRGLLQSTCALALTALLPRDALGASPPSKAAGPSERMAAFNGGRTQVNVNAMQWGGAYPFLNLLKTAQTWSLNDGSGLPHPDILDADGYPTKLTNGGVYTVFDAPSQAVRPGAYVVTWKGTGTISLGMSNTRISGDSTSLLGRGRYVFSTTDSRFVLRIAAVGRPHITDLKVFHVDDEAAINAGHVFGAKFKERLLEARFGVIRFLGWQDGNTSNVTTWATRKPVTYYSYGAQELRAGIFAGMTSNEGSAFRAALAGFQLVDKAMVTLIFNASCNGPCTLDVNGTGPVDILSEYSGPLDKWSYPIGGTWQSMATLVYDASLKAWIKFGADIAGGSSGISNGCPPELMVQLCAEVGAHPYFVTPHLAIDPATDFIPSLAAYCRDNGPPWMIPRFEGPNETWNYAAGFLPTHYAKAKAAAYGWGPDVHNWYGKAMSVLGQAVSMAYNGDRSRYQVLCGVQTVIGGNSSVNPRLASTKYVAQPEPPQGHYSKTPAASWVTHVCCAQYYTPSEYGTPQEEKDAAAFMAAADDIHAQMEIATGYAETSYSGNGPFTLEKCAKLYAGWKAWALSFKVTKMCGYEGGYSPDYTGGGKTPVDRLRAASKLSDAMYDLTILNYNNFIGLSDRGFSAEFPSCFQLSGRPAPSSAAWSVLEDVYAPNPPQWNAIVAFNH